MADSREKACLSADPPKPFCLPQGEPHRMNGSGREVGDKDPRTDLPFFRGFPVRRRFPYVLLPRIRILALGLLALFFPEMLRANILAIEFRRGVTFEQTGGQAPSAPLFYDVSSDIQMANSGVTANIVITNPNAVTGNYIPSGSLGWQFFYSTPNLSDYASAVPDGPGPYTLQFSGGSIGTFNGNFTLQSLAGFSPGLPYLSTTEFAYFQSTFDPTQAFTVNPLLANLTDPTFGGTTSSAAGIGVMIWDPADSSLGGIHYGATIPGMTLQPNKEYELFMWTQTDFILSSEFNAITSSPDATSTVNMTINKFKVTTVPEPSALSLLAGGLGVLFRRSRKRD